ncbi:insulin-like growth factor binding protein [Mycena filopes]|nr:insulin-like growth factor binding protein [Mycena filopes]
MAMSGEPSAVGPPSSANRLPSSYKNQNQYNLRVVNELGGLFGADTPNSKLQLRVVPVSVDQLWTPCPKVMMQLPWHQLTKISIRYIDIPSFFTILQNSTSLSQASKFEFFEDPSSDDTCDSCDSSCTTYSGPTSSDCLTCASPQYLTGLNQSCPDGTFVDGSACSSCDTSCATCSESGTCLTCPSTFYFDAGECVQTCPDGTTPTRDTDTCDACDSSCDTTCSGPTSGDCLTCAPPKHLSLNQCVDTCPDGTFVDGSACSSCDSSCVTCSGPSACLTCSTGFDKFDSAVKCAHGQTCPDGTTLSGGAYPRSSYTDTCDACDSSCATCS